MNGLYISLAINVILAGALAFEKLRAARLRRERDEARTRAHRNAEIERQARIVNIPPAEYRRFHNRFHAIQHGFID